MPNFVTDMIKYFEVEGRRLAYTDEGNGDVIVLLHGYLESHLIFGVLADKLSVHFRVVSVDLPGHGQSDTISECHSMEMMASRINLLLDYLGIDRILLTGHSLGGYVALAFVELFGEKVAGYCLFHSHPFADTPAATARREREKRVILAGKKLIMYPGNIRKMYSPDNLAKMRGEIERSDQIASQTPDEGIVAVLNGMISRPSRLHLMERGDVPLLWILGLHDQYIDYRHATESVKLPENATLATLYDTGHLGFIEEPARSVSLLSEFAFRVFGEEFRA